MQLVQYDNSWIELVLIVSFGSFNKLKINV